MPIFGIGKQEEPTLEELQESNERLKIQVQNKQLELTKAQKEAALKKLREAGLSGKDFSWNWDSIKRWVRGR
jgi:predicted transcriptional regulator